MKEPAILWEQLAIGNGIERCISSQRLALSQSRFTAKGREGRKRKKEFWVSKPFAIFASVAVKLLWLTAEC